MEKIRNLIDSADSILLLAHKSSDGDAVGSALAIYNYLVRVNKNVDIIIDDMPSVFNFLPNADKIKSTSKEINYDLVIVVDCSNLERIGQDRNYFENAKYTLNIDHHATNTRYANYNYISKLPACSQYLEEIFDCLGIEITPDIASCLAVGVITDTGGFQYANVDYRTYDFASRMSKIVNIQDIYKKVYITKTKAQFELSKIATSRLKFINNNRIALTYLTKEDFVSVNAVSGDHEGIANIGRDIDGVIVSIFIREIDSGYRVSLRSNGNFDVSKIALSFDGGGHRNSSGFDSDLDFNDLKDKLLELISNDMGK